jgi:hypothetical protein
MAKPVVQVFSSTDEILNGSPYTNYFLPALKSGIANQINVLQPVSAGDDYDTNSANNILTKAKTLDKTANLIITLGGLVAAEAVAQLKASDYPSATFLVLVGNTPKHQSWLEKRDNNKIPLLGGVDLESTTLNPARADALVAKWPNVVTDRTKICLYYNNNSHMIAEELTEWEFHVRGLTFPSSVSQSNYTKTAFGTDFNGLPAGTQAVVVSSDPFFAAKASDLSAAATNVYVCYPTSAYTASTKGIVYGSSLNDAYKALGAKANKYLNDLMQGTPPAYMGLDIQAAAGLLTHREGKPKPRKAPKSSSGRATKSTRKAKRR